MEAIEILMREHRAIERVVEALDAAADRLEDGTSVRPGFFLEAAEFFAGFADGVHHRKEEDVLFDSLVEGGLPAGQGPVPVMRSEHEEARALTRGLREAARRLDGGDPGARSQVIAQARRYSALIRDHIAKEDQVLFPMAAGLLTPKAATTVLEGFRRQERDDARDGTSERLLALGDRLVREAATP